MTVTALLLALIASPNIQATREPILLDFHASWCGPCQQMRPAVEELIRNGYPIQSVDFDRSPKLVDRYQVVRVPTFIVVDASGRELARTEGYQPATQLAGFYRKARTKARPPASTDGDAVEDEAPAPLAEVKDAVVDAPGAGSPPSGSNPLPWESVVRIKVVGNGAIGFGSGTIIHSTAEQSIILTCAHIFKLEGSRQAHPSQFPRRIDIDLFDGKLSGTRPAQVHFVETVQGKALDYDFNRDVGLIVIRPGRRLPASRVVPPSWNPRPGTKMTTVGCSEGHDATAWTTSIVNLGVRLFDNSNYEAIECIFAPKQGRSGGGLYTLDGYVAGVCDFAEPRGNHGFYATPRSIYTLLDRNRLTALYTPGSRLGGALLAKNQPAPARPKPPSIARAQSPDREDSEDVTIPPPELLGIRTPKVAQGPGRVTGGSPQGWRIPRSTRTVPEPIEETEPTDLSLPPSANNDRFDAVPESDDRTSDEVPPPSRSLGRWRPVRSGTSPLPAPSAN